jgi:hypothetical protein
VLSGVESLETAERTFMMIPVVAKAYQGRVGMQHEWRTASGKPKKTQFEIYLPHETCPSRQQVKGCATSSVGCTAKGQSRTGAKVGKCVVVFRGDFGEGKSFGETKKIKSLIGYDM